MMDIILQIIIVYQFMSFKAFCVEHGCLHNNITTESALAGMNPSTNTFFTPHE